MNDILVMSATEIAQKIRNKSLSPIDAVEAHIKRIEAVNPQINAVITPTFEQARQEAQVAQNYIDTHGTEDLPPLFGVPVTIKDCWAVKGVRFTGGSWYLRDHIAEEDAESVKLLRNAGAIILGKTNLPDMCWSAETTNPIFGQTNNPHDVRYTAGGSSGGEGAIIAAGGSPLGLGSDIAGSVRIPAAANGIFSLKPTSGRIPAEDHVPDVSPEVAPWNTCGPMARRVEDLALALKVLSRTPVQDYKQISLKDRNCLVYIHNRVIPVRQSVIQTVLKAADTLKAAGMSAQRNDTLPIAHLSFLYAALMGRYGNKDFRRTLGGGRPYNLGEQIGHHMRGEKHISGRVLWFTEYIDMAAGPTKLMGYQSFDKLESYRQNILSQMGEGGVILCPLFITPPPRHGWTWMVFFYTPYTVMFNALGFPAVVLPVGYNPQGLPMAVQIVARPGEDEVALAVAAELERVHGGWKMANP